MHKSERTTGDTAVRLLIVAACFGLLYSAVTEYHPDARRYNATVCAVVVLWTLLLAPLALAAKRSQTPMDKAFLSSGACLAATLLVAVGFSPLTDISAARLKLYWSLFVFGLVLRQIVAKPSSALVCQVLLAISVIHAIFLTVALIAASAHDLSLKFTPPYFSNVRHLGYLDYIGAASGFAVGHLDKRFRSAGFALAIYALIGAALLGSRAVFVAWAVSVACLAMVWCDGGRKRIAWSGVIALGIAVGSAFVIDHFNVTAATSIFDRTGMGGSDSILAADSRLNVWKASMAKIAERPLIGWGPDGFVIARLYPGMLVQPHNVVLQVLLEIGVVGLAALTWFLWVAMGPRVKSTVARRRYGKIDNREAAILAVLMGFLAYGMVDGVFYHAIPLIHLAILCALWIASADVSNPIGRTPHPPSVGEETQPSYTSVP